jgi:hypothetical protein
VESWPRCGERVEKSTLGGAKVGRAPHSRTKSVHGYGGKANRRGWKTAIPLSFEELKGKGRIEIMSGKRSKRYEEGIGLR